MERLYIVSFFIVFMNIAFTTSQRGFPCLDRDVNCYYWAKTGACSTHHRYMVINCPKSCYFCGSRPIIIPPRQTIANPTFDCGRPYSEKEESSRKRLPRQTPEVRQERFNGSLKDMNSERPATQEFDIQVEDTICGATVIHPQYLLTAAHCVLDPQRPVGVVRLGELDFSQTGESNSRTADYIVESIIVHPNYDRNLIARYNDVALLKTRKVIEFNEAVYPSCISTDRPKPGTVVTVSGFGKVNETFQSPTLQEADLDVVNLTECETRYRQEGMDGVMRRRYPNLLQGSDVICAGYPGRGACEGDGGGPLTRDDQDGRRFLVGMVSVAMACKGDEASNLPGLYVDVANHIDFIDSVIYG